MNMKKHITLFRVVTSVMLAVALTGCTQFEEEDLFEDSAALRTEKNADKLQDILTNAPQGWVMQYYTGRGISVFEGFNLFARFEKSGKVTLAGNHRFLRDGRANIYTEYASLYELIREEGLVLAFNTWNDVLTPFVDPVAFYYAPDNLLKDGEGMQGDQNLVVMTFNDNEITFRGERYGGAVRMVRADRSWTDYIADTEKMKNFITSENLKSYYLIGGNDTMYCVGLYDGRYRISERIKNPLHTDSVSCCFTPTGFRNERIDTIGGHLFQEFKLNADSTALVNEDGSVKIFATWDTYLAEATNIMWMDDLTMSDDLKTLYDQLDAAFKASNRNYSLARLGIGKTTNANNVTGLVVQWFTNTRKTSRKMGGMALERSVPAMGQMTISCAENAILDNEMKGKSDAIISIVRSLGAVLSGTYKLTANNNFVPTGALYQSINGQTSFSVASEN